MTCDNDQTIESDGNTPDTDGLLAALAEAATFSFGVEIVLPAGVCDLNKQIDIPTTQSMRFTGAGIGVTTLQFITPSGATPPANGLAFAPSNGASLTVDHFTIVKKAGTNLGTSFLGTALSIEASTASPAVGDVTVSGVDIFPAGAGSQTDGWNIGLLERNLSDPVISNVTISMPGWAAIPDPSGYLCTAGPASAPCAIHALQSPSNPVNTPSNLAFGNEVGVALQGVGAHNFQIDTVINGLTVSGGLVGLDAQQFQGVYVNGSKFTADVYGVRADTPGTVSELLAVSDSEFTNTVGGIYANGIGGSQLTGNYLIPTDGGTTNLPGWTAVWVRNGETTTISSNNIVGSGTAVVPEYGIYVSADIPNGYPVAISGNTIYSLSSPASVCMGNNGNQVSINASGNSLFSCAAYIADANGGNGYADNTLQYPDIYEDGSRNIQVPKGLTIGTANDPGSLRLENDGVTTLYAASNGTIYSLGMINSQGAITSNGAVTGSSLTTGGPLNFQGNSAHTASQEIVGNFYYPYGGGSNTITLNPPSGNFPSVQAGIATIFGELTCTGGGTISWHVVGHYSASNGKLTPMAFSATPENDADSQAFIANHQMDTTVTPVANPNALGLQVVFGTVINQVVDCTASLTEMVAN